MSAPSLAQRIFAWLLHKLSPASHKYVRPWKQQAFAGNFQGQVKDVVEIGESAFWIRYSSWGWIRLGLFGCRQKKPV